MFAVPPNLSARRRPLRLDKGFPFNARQRLTLLTTAFRLQLGRVIRADACHRAYTVPDSLRVLFCGTYLRHGFY